MARFENEIGEYDDGGITVDDLNDDKADEEEVNIN